MNLTYLHVVSQYLQVAPDTKYTYICLSFAWFLAFCFGTRYETILEVRPKVRVLDHQASYVTCKLLLILWAASRKCK